MPDKTQTKNAMININLKLPLGGVGVVGVLSDFFEPKIPPNLFLKSLITSSNSGGVWPLPPQGF